MIALKRLLLLSIIALAGCATTDRAALNVGIADVSIADASASGMEAVFTLQIKNENLFPLVIEKEVHKIHLNGNFIGEARGEKTFGVHQLGTVQHKVTIRLDSSADAERLRAILASGSADFRIESRLTTNTYDRKDVIVNESSGRMTLPSR